MAPACTRASDHEPVHHRARRQPRHRPRSSRCAKASGRPAARIAAAAPAWSYGTRWNASRPCATSSSAYIARVSPSRGCPTEPTTASQWRCAVSGTATPATGAKPRCGRRRRGNKAAAGARGRRTPGVRPTAPAPRPGSAARAARGPRTPSGPARARSRAPAARRPPARPAGARRGRRGGAPASCACVHRGGLVFDGDDLRRRVRRGGVVVAAHHPGARRRERHHLFQHRDRLGAVADQVAEEGELRRAARPRMRQARRERARIGMQVGQQRQLHAAIMPKTGDAGDRGRGCRGSASRPRRQPSSERPRHHRRCLLANQVEGRPLHRRGRPLQAGGHRQPDAQRRLADSAAPCRPRAAAN